MYGDEIFIVAPEVWPLKENIDKMHFIKIKTSSVWKTANGMTRQSTDWEEIFAKYIQNRTNNQHREGTLETQQ